MARLRGVPRDGRCWSSSASRRDRRRAHGCLRAAIAHRTGRLEVGEASVAIAVSAAHRAAALTACKQAIDTLKQTVPIWKKERYADGEEWVSQGS